VAKILNGKYNSKLIIAKFSTIDLIDKKEAIA